MVPLLSCRQFFFRTSHHSLIPLYHSCISLLFLRARSSPTNEHNLTLIKGPSQSVGKATAFTLFIFMGHDAEGRLLARISSCCRLASEEWFTFRLQAQVTPFRLASEHGLTLLDASYLMVTPYTKQYIYGLDDLIHHVSLSIDGVRKCHCHCGVFQ